VEWDNEICKSNYPIAKGYWELSPSEAEWDNETRRVCVQISLISAAVRDFSLTAFLIAELVILIKIPIVIGKY